MADGQPKEAPDLPAGWWRPRYWPVWVLWPVLQALAAIRYPSRLRIGRWFGRVLYRLLGQRRRIAERNLALCFPERDEQQRAHLLEAHFEALGIAAAEIPSAWWSRPDRLAPLVRLAGREHLEQAMEQGRGAILVSAHFISMEVGLRLFSHEMYLCAVYRPNNNPMIDYLINRGRSGHHGEMIDRGDLRRILRTLKANVPVWYPPDQDHGPRHSVFVPFFGIPAATLTATTRLAKLSGAPVIPCYFHRLSGTQGYEITLLPALEDFPGDDEAQDARRLNALLEEQIRRSPEQYLWVHRRFKTRPANEQDATAPAIDYPRRRKPKAPAHE